MSKDVACIEKKNKIMTKQHSEDHFISSCLGAGGEILLALLLL